MTESNEGLRQVGLLLLSLLLSIVAAVLPDWGILGFTKSDEIVLGVVLFSTFLVLDILWLTTKVAARSQREEALWILREECDTHLLNVSRCFVRISREAYGAKDLFVRHFRKEIRDLAEKIASVAERRELRVQADHFLNVDNVLDAFQGDAERIWRYTWAIEPSEPLFDELAWKRYFERTATMVEAGQIKEVRTILVVESPGSEQNPRTQKLLDFFQTNQGFSCCLVAQKDFRTLCADNSVPVGYIDFGIYGNRLLFLTEQYEPEIYGVFTKDPAQIQHYCHLFDSIWGSTSVARRNPSEVSQRVSLSELYKFDEESGS